MAVTGSDITAAPRRASAWTMSRSLAIPSTVVPSCETTTAPIRCSASTATRCRTLVSGVTVMTWVPLTRSTSLIRIGPPRQCYAADRMAVPIPPGWILQSRPLLPGSVVAVNRAGGEGGCADGYVLRAVRSGRAVAHPFPWPGVNALAGLDRQLAVVRLHHQRPAQHDGEFVELRALPGLSPA